MAIIKVTETQQSERERLQIDKQWLRKMFTEMDTRSGFVVDPTMTVEKMRELMQASGIRQEKNEFSREILRDRYPEDFSLDQA